jgi:hypothetical protein
MWREGLTGEGTKEKCIENVLLPVLLQLLALHPWAYGR